MEQMTVPPKALALQEADKFNEEKIEQVKVIQEFLDMEQFNPNMKELFWGFFNKHTLLGNLKKEDEEIIYRNFYNMIDIYKNSQPSYKNTVELQNQFANMTFLLPIMISRARQGFERKLDSTTIKQFISTEESSKPKGRGFWSRLIPWGNH